MANSSTYGRNFIIITDAPQEGREARRAHVRRTVMLNYHERKRQKIQHMRGGDAPASPSCAETDRTKRVGLEGRSNCLYEESHSLETKLVEHIAPSVRPMDRCPAAEHLLQPKIWADSTQNRAITMVTRFFCGQIKKMTQDICCVSFIHHQVVRVNAQADEMRNPLMVCGDILRDHHSGRGVWEQISQAQENIYRSCTTFGRWRLLSAAQALILYILLRVNLGANSSVFPNGDIALLFTLRKVFKLLQSRHLLSKPPSDVCSKAVVGDWEDWIFTESSTRTATIYFLLSVVVSVDFGIDCTHPTDWHFEHLPLPAGKVIWEARDRRAWTNVMTTIANDNMPTLTFGDLMDIDRSYKRDLLDTWQGEVDELGLVVSMACHLRALQ